MLALALLMAFAPTEDAVPFGPPVPNRAARPPQQARRAAQADWRRFQQRWGQWVARWDSRNDTPRFLLSPGTPLSEADALVADIARLARVPAQELALARTVSRGERTFFVYDRAWRGAAVEGDEVLLIARGGQVVGAQVQLTPLRLLQAPLPGEVVFVDPDGRAHLAARSEQGPDVVYTDRDRREVYRYDTRRYAEVRVSHEERTIDDAVVESPARNILVTDQDGNTQYTDELGQHSLTGQIVAKLTGPELSVTVTGREIERLGGEDFLFEGGEDLPLSAATVQHHFHEVWDWLKDRWPDHPWLTEQVLATVEARGGSCNAYYTQGTITFLPENEESCHNFGQIADVVYHEVGHGIHDYIRVAGTFAGDVSEGSADYVSATILGDPVLAPNARLDGGFIREIDTDKVYPDDAIGQVHNDGLIWASFLWNLRTQWQATYGDDVGAEMADLILLGALELGPTLTDMTEAVLLADDDNGDPTDGTPHDCELLDLLNQHGIGPGTIGVLSFDHEPLRAQASATEGYPVTFDVSTWPANCASFDEASVALRYTTDPDAALDDAGAWTSAPLSTDGLTWDGEIPRQPAGAEVRYFLTASSPDGAETMTTHGGREDALYTFRVGDRAPLFCESFEDGADGWRHAAGLPWAEDKKGLDDWAIGAPTGGTDDPAAAYDGASIAATNLDGAYAANSLSFLQSPVWTVDDPGPMFMLSYQRHLTVEDGFYDHATLWNGEALLWENPASESGSDAHLIDTDWTLHDIPLDAGGDIQLTWALESDGGLEYGGWAIDSVCLVQLADPEGHYRVDDLAATGEEGGPITISWTQPWVTPLSATILVRSADGWPTGPDDGLIVDVDLTPTPGEARSTVDDDAQPGEAFYYAVFSAGADDEDWYLDVVEGENAALASLDEEAEDTGTAPEPEPEDTGDAAPTEDDCGCRGGGSAVLLAPLLLLGAARRRRQVR